MHCSSAFRPQNSRLFGWPEVFQSTCQPWKSSALNLVDTISQSLFLTLLGIGLGGLEQSEGAADVLHVLGALVCTALLTALRPFGAGLDVAR